MRRSAPSSRRLLLAGAWLSLALTALACSDSFSPLPERAARVDPPAVYALWWAEVQACAGSTRSIGSVDWYVVPDAEVVRADGRDAAGYYQAPGRIVLAGKHAMRGAVVRHEMLHAMVAASGHPREYFLQRCGEVVSCQQNCMLEAGEAPVPSPGIARIEPTALKVEVTVGPATPRKDRFDGHFVIVVTAHNPKSYPVVVNLPPSTDQMPSVGFSFGVSTEGRSSWYNDRVFDAGLVYFKAGETKRAVYDYRIGASFEDNVLIPGTYTVTGAFSSKPAPASRLVIRP